MPKGKLRWYSVAVADVRIRNYRIRAYSKENACNQLRNILDMDEYDDDFVLSAEEEYPSGGPDVFPEYGIIVKEPVPEMSGWPVVQRFFRRSK